MGIEGRLQIDLRRRSDGSGEAKINSSRPMGLARAFRGKRIEEAVQLLPLLYSVCGLAQGVAAAEACERALGLEVSPRTSAARQLLVLAEAAREHLIRATGQSQVSPGDRPDDGNRLSLMRAFEKLRLAIDPSRRALSVGADASLDVPIVMAAIDNLTAFIEERVLGESAEEFLRRRTAGDLDLWRRQRMTPAQILADDVIERDWQSAGDAGTRFLTEIDDREILELLLDEGGDEFARSPVWEGAPHETSTLGRQRHAPLVRDLVAEHGNGLLTRLGARLVELARLPDIMRRLCTGAEESSEPWVRSSSPASRRGLAHVEAARGRLIHGVERNGDTIAAYAILAPTEWNFHPEGAGRDALARIASEPSDVGALANLFIATLDPCVAFDVRVH